MEVGFTWIGLVANIGLSVAGLIGFALISVRKHLFGGFSRSKFWNENKIFLIWAFSFQMLYSIIMAFYPVLEQAIAKWLAGILMAASPFEVEIPEGLTTTVVYLFGTWLLSLLVNREIRPEDKIGKRKI